MAGVLRLRLPLAIVALALVIRVGLMFSAGLQSNMTDGQPHQFGAEVATVASHIAAGIGFNSALIFAGDTGPTAIVSPLYTFLLAGIFKAFGTYTLAALVAALLFNCIVSALTCLPVMAIGRRLYGERASIVVGLGWAVVPYGIWHPAYVVAETCLAALLFTCIVWLSFRLGSVGRPRGWAALGALLGITALTNAQSLAGAPFILEWARRRLRRAGQPWLGPLAVCVTVAAIIVLPWLVRNYLVFGTPTFLRSNSGAELAIGFNAESEGPATRQLVDKYSIWTRQPTQTAELQRYKDLGESAYMAEQEQAAFSFIAAHPATALSLVVKRIGYTLVGTEYVNAIFWLDGRFLLQKQIAYAGFMLTSIAGIVLLWRARRPEAFLLAALIAAYLAPEILLYPTERHRHVIEPIMTVLSAAPVLWLAVRIRSVAGLASLRVLVPRLRRA